MTLCSTYLSCHCVACPGTLLSFLASRDTLTNEESLLVDALLAIFESRMSSADDILTLRVLMREMFPSSVRLRTSCSHGPGKHASTSTMLNDAIVTQLRALGLQPTDSSVSKVRIVYFLPHCLHYWCWSWRAGIKGTTSFLLGVGVRL